MTGSVPALALAVLLSTHAPAAPVQLALRATFELHCGWPGPSVAVVFPTAERLPARIDVAHVLVDGMRAASIERHGRLVRLEVARPEGVMCDSIAPGVVRVLFARAAGIRNPGRAGTYALRLTHGASSATGTYAVS